MQTLKEDHHLGPDDLFSINARTITTLVLTCLCALLANAAGIGGGPIYLPLLMVSSEEICMTAVAAAQYQNLV